MRKGTRYKKSKVFKRLISLIFFIIFLTLFIISGIKIINYIKDQKANSNVMNNISKDIRLLDNANAENTNRYSINFDSLKEKNPDTVGFLKVNGTDIEHVVVKAKNNGFYLSHNFEKEYNIAGWIFADYHNKFDGTDKNIIIYGHNMRNNTMFGTLKNILNKDWQENSENKVVTLVTEEGENKYEVFSVYQIEDEDYYITTSFRTDEYKAFLDKLKSRSQYDFNADISDVEQILTLSTCANNNKYRIVLHAKKINE